MMGCLFELVFEVIFELLLELVLYIYFELMMLIVPQKKISEKARREIKKIVKGFSVIMPLFIILGLLLMFSGISLIELIGSIMVYLPLSIILLQIILGIILKVISKIRNKKND